MIRLAGRKLIATMVAIGAISQSTPVMADACDDEVAQLASKIGATIGRKGPSGMIALRHSNASEITFGCPPPSKFLVIFGTARPRLEFMEFLTLAGSVFTGQPAPLVRTAAERCIAAALADRSGFSRLPFGKFTLDCGDGRNGIGPKVTFEE